MKLITYTTSILALSMLMSSVATAAGRPSVSGNAASITALQLEDVAQQQAITALQQENADQEVAITDLEQAITDLQQENVDLAASLCELASASNIPLAACGPLEGNLRIVDGANADEGRLELFFDNQWGTVCDDRWDINDAAVACRQMGYSGADAALYTFNVVDGTGPILLDDVQCTGSESSLLDCAHREPVGSHNCSHFEDAGVRCTVAP